jgi:hypothetical protein
MKRQPVVRQEFPLGSLDAAVQRAQALKRQAEQLVKQPSRRILKPKGKSLDG